MTHLSTVKSGSGFTSMVKEPLMDRMFGKSTPGSGYMAEMTSAPTQKSTHSTPSGGLVRVEQLEQAKNYTSSKSYRSSSKIDTSGQSTFTSGIAAITPIHSSNADADRFERSSTPDSDGDNGLNETAKDLRDLMKAINLLK